MSKDPDGGLPGGQSDGPPEVEPEIFIVDADGSPVSGAASASARSVARSRMGTGQRLGILLGVVAVFAFGVVTGRSTLRVQSGIATPAPTTAASPTGQPGSTNTASPKRDQSSDASLDQSPEATTGTGPPVIGPADGESENVPQRYAQTIDICGGQSYVAQIGYVSPLPTPIDMTILAGSPPRRYDLSSGTVGPPLVKLRDDEFVSGLATDDHGTVVTVRNCADWSAKIVRVTDDGVVTSIDLPAEWGASGRLVENDGQIWAELKQRGDSSSDRLLATDGSGDIKPMPDEPDWAGGQTSAVSPDGSRTAKVIVPDTDHTPGYHVQVIDTTTEETTLVPGIRLGAASASVAFSPDSQWLVVAVSTLAGGRILVYGPDDLQGPYSIPGTVLSGPPTSGVAIYITGP